MQRRCKYDIKGALKRIRRKRSPWVTKYRELLSKIRKRDFLKKKAISSNNPDNPATWDQFGCARNQPNNAIKLAKKLYVGFGQPGSQQR